MKRSSILLSGLVMWSASLILAAEERRPPEPHSAIPDQLALETCFEMAIRYNKEIRAAELLAKTQRARILAAEGDFDTTFVAENLWTRADTPTGTVPEDEVRTADGAFSTGFTKRFVSGTEVDLRANLDYTDDLDNHAGYDPLVDSDAFLRIRQDLLRNRGTEINRTNIMVARDLWYMARETFRDTLIRTLLDVERTYWDLFFSQADLKVREDQLARANRLVSVAEAQVRVGGVAPIEVTRAKSNVGLQAIAILDSRNRIATLRRRLLLLLGFVTSAEAPDTLALTDSPPPPTDSMTLEACLETAYEKRPDCVRARLDVQRAERLEIFAENQCLPTLQVYGGVGLRGLDDHIDGSAGDMASGEYDTWEVGVRLDVPLGNRTAKGTYQAATMARRRADVRRKAVWEKASREVGDAFDALNTARKRIETASESRRLTAVLLRAEEKSFRLGRSNSLDVISAQQNLATAEREVVRARVAYASALSALLAVRGDFVEAKGLQSKLPAEADEEHSGKQGR